jgi:hypothetical protein
MMMHSLVLLAAILLNAEGFSPAKHYPRSCPYTTVSMSSESSLVKDYTAGSGMNDDTIPVFIKNLSKDNFEASLEMLEPLLMNECIGDECEFYLGELHAKASEIGVKIPDGYAPSHH